MTTITTTDLANVAYAAGATHVADWYDMQFGIDHVSRYFSGSSRVVERDDKDHDVIVQIDGTQGARGDVTRRIMVVAGDTEALERSGDHARQLGRALIAAADEVDRCATR
jgi:carbon monoxide dehydrogenase subunit G